jgi:predicted esterase
MRGGLIGFVLALALMAAVLFVAQRALVRVVAPDLDYQFAQYVFSGDEFPFGDLAQGRAMHRFLFPVRISTTFYNAQFQPVTRPDQPGRYGAIVRIALNGAVESRDITLFHTPVPVFWGDGPMAITAQLPPGTGIDPLVAQKQMPQIAVMLGDILGTAPSQWQAQLLAGLSETRPDDPPAVARDNFLARDQAWWNALHQRIGRPISYPCLVDLPRDYDADPARRWPVVLYLHGVGERGEGLQTLRRTGLGLALAKGRPLPAIAISPHLPTYADWNVPALARLLDDLPAQYRVDPDRIYLLGASAGGDAVWHLALTFPDRFAALAVMAGECRDDDFARLRHVPVWIFQGAKDVTVNPAASLGVAAALTRAGGHPHVTLYPEAEHDCWDQALATDAFYTWLLFQIMAKYRVPIL